MSAPPLVRHGWTIAFQPQLFARQYAELKAKVRRLKQELDPQAFVQHPQVKLLAAVMEGIKERIAADPYASRFALTGPLRRYGRLKGLGLPIIDHGSHIVPVHVGNPIHCKMLSDMLLDQFGIYVQPINFPTVPRGTERLRFTPSPVHDARQIDHLVKAMDSLWGHCALNRAEISA